MSDATVRNFCSYNCAVSFQNQFPQCPITYGSETRTQPVSNASTPTRRYSNRRNQESGLFKFLQALYEIE